MNFAAKFETGLPYLEFLDKYANTEQRRRWDAVHADVALARLQREIVAGFGREMKVLVLAGAWCGDCVNQCPIFDHFASANKRIGIRYFDRDDNAALADAVSLCGGRRVPCVMFLSEDGYECGRYGDRTLSRYRQMAAEKLGTACPSGLFPPEQTLLEAVTHDWLNEFERIQLMLRTSGRLRELHGD